MRLCSGRSPLLTLLPLLVLTLLGRPEGAAGQASTVRAFVAPSYNRMGAWAEGLDILRARAEALDYDVATSLDPGVGISVGGGALWDVRPGLALGLEGEWLRDRLLIEVPQPTMRNFRSLFQATATSAVLRVLARLVPSATQPLALEGSAGVGRGALDWSTSQGRAVGAGWGPYVGMSGVMERQRRGLRLAVSLGARWHPVFLSYSDASVTPPGGLCLDDPEDVACPVRLFEDTADLEAFLDGRHADFSGFYLSFQVAWSR